MEKKIILILLLVISITLIVLTVGVFSVAKEISLSEYDGYIRSVNPFEVTVVDPVSVSRF